MEQFVNMKSLIVIEGRSLAGKCSTPLCLVCRTKIEEIVDKERKIIWDNIPFNFGFPGWDVLRTKMEEFS